MSDLTQRDIAQTHWYLIQTKPRQGLRAEENLTNQGYTVFHPLLQVEKLRGGRRVVRTESLFPNYLFIHLCRGTDDWGPIRSTRGVSRLVNFAGEPAIVPDAAIAEIETQLARKQPRQLLQAGQKVLVTEGCFRGLEAIFQTFDGEQRAILLLNFLHQQSTLVLPLTSFEAIS